MRVNKRHVRVLRFSNEHRRYIIALVNESPRESMAIRQWERSRVTFVKNANVPDEIVTRACVLSADYRRGRSRIPVSVAL